MKIFYLKMKKYFQKMIQNNKHKNDNKYIFDNPKVTYIKGVVKTVNGVTTFIPDEKGKTIHGDIHPGNIFIDIPAMRKGEDNFFTLIDTGNTIKRKRQTFISAFGASSNGSGCNTCK